MANIASLTSQNLANLLSQMEKNNTNAIPACLDWPATDASKIIGWIDDTWGYTIHYTDGSIG